MIHADRKSGLERAACRLRHEGGSTTQDGYRIDDVCRSNGAESYFSRLRRGELLGHHHHIAGPYLVRYAQGGGLA